MGTCSGCGDKFPRLELSKCMKCEKLEAVSSDIERNVIRSKPQCQGCSCVYPFLSGALCGACKDDPIVLSSNDQFKHLLQEKAQQHADVASQHRLNQPARPQNAQLQSATAVHERLTALKKQAKSDTVFVETALWIYPLQANRQAQKAQILPVYKKYFGSDPAHKSFSDAITDLKRMYFELPNPQKLNFVDVQYGVQHAAKSVYDFRLTEQIAAGTMEQMFNGLKKISKTTKVDSKSKQVTFRLYVHQVAPSDSDEEQDSKIRQPSFLRTSTVKGQTKSTAKRKASNSFSSATPSSYRSSFRPQRSDVYQIEYDTYKFKKLTFDIDPEGNISQHESAGPFTIEIAKDWQKNIGQQGKEGYISQGFMKYAFLGRIGDTKYAVFQCKPTRDTASDNLADLTAELRLLTYGQYFAKSFAARAASEQVELPGTINWNSDAFIGTIVGVLPPAPTGDEPDTRSLIFPTFLAAPLLCTTGLYTERKFCGSDGIGNNKDNIGRAVDAYTHHVVVDSGGTILLTDLQGIVGPGKAVVLYDPQAHSIDQDSGFWDEGREFIAKWLKEHKCNAMCVALKLKNAAIQPLSPPRSRTATRGPGPLRIGFDS